MQQFQMTSSLLDWKIISRRKEAKNEEKEEQKSERRDTLESRPSEYLGTKNDGVKCGG
jgi:hypothetical protein